MGPMKKSAAAWSLAGVVAGFAGLATSYLVSMVMNLRLSPIPAVAELVVRIAPDSAFDAARGRRGCAPAVGPG